MKKILLDLSNKNIRELIKFLLNQSDELDIILLANKEEISKLGELNEWKDDRIQVLLTNDVEKSIRVYNNYHIIDKTDDFFQMPTTPVNYFSSSINEFLLEIGEDPDRKGLIDTPNRFLHGMKEMCQGYKIDISKCIKLFPVKSYDQMIISKNIFFGSLCEHHLLPFFGYVHIGYIPDKEIYGLSKLSRIVFAYSKRLQDQEKLTVQIAEELSKHLNTICIIVYIEAKHTCDMLRRTYQNSIMTTNKIIGKCKDENYINFFWNSINDRKKI